MDTKRGLLMTTDSVMEGMRKQRDDIAAKEEAKRQKKIQREAEKARRVKEKQEKQARREEKKREMMDRDGESSRTRQNRKRRHPGDVTSSNTNADADKENDAERYIDIAIDTSQLQYTHTKRVLGEIQSITS